MIIATSTLFITMSMYPAYQEDCRSHVATACLNAADGRFKEAISFYEPLVQGHLENLLEVTAIVLANLCVCYIMTSQNDQAEALMRQVERQEEQQASQVRTVRSDVVPNAVIGAMHEGIALSCCS